MRVKVAELTKNQGIRFYYDFVMPLEEFPEAGIIGPEPVTVAMEAVYLGREKGILMEGTFQSLLRPRCHRCLEEYPLDLKGDFREDVQLDGDCTVNQEDSCLGDAIDLAALAREHLLLSLPLKFLCRQDCRGICPMCGRDLRDGECGCEEDTIDPRLEKLREFLND